MVAETVTFNTTAASLDDYCTFSFVNDRKAAKKAEEYVKKFEYKNTVDQAESGISVWWKSTESGSCKMACCRL